MLPYCSATALTRTILRHEPEPIRSRDVALQPCAELHFASVLQLRLVKRIEQIVVEDWGERATPSRPPV